jgi:hypothetical protein
MRYAEHTDSGLTQSTGSSDHGLTATLALISRPFDKAGSRRTLWLAGGLWRSPTHYISPRLLSKKGLIHSVVAAVLGHMRRNNA